MTAARPVIFWWVTPSIHMEPCMREFAELWSGETLAVWCAPLSPERQALGWRAPQLGSMPQRSLAADDKIAEGQTKRIVAEFPGAFHLYSGWKGNSRCYTSFKAARKDSQARHLVVAEPFRGWGVRRYTRHVRALLQTLPYRGQLQAILAMGEAGVSFYRSLRFRSHIVFPFIYQSPSYGGPLVRAPSKPVRFVYVGKFDSRKGLQDLLAAFRDLRDAPWTLTIIGDGHQRRDMERLGSSMGIADRVDWKGVMTHNTLMRKLASYDVAVIPSRFDGWGVVTNEALHAGLAVLVSDRASSMDLARYSHAGLIFGAGDIASLKRCVREMLSQESKLAAMKVAACEYQRRITGEMVAGYLRDVLQFLSNDYRGMRPQAPWVDSGWREQ